MRIIPISLPNQGTTFPVVTLTATVSVKSPEDNE